MATKTAAQKKADAEAAKKAKPDAKPDDQSSANEPNIASQPNPKQPTDQKTAELPKGTAVYASRYSNLCVGEQQFANGKLMTTDKAVVKELESHTGFGKSFHRVGV